MKRIRFSGNQSAAFVLLCLTFAPSFAETRSEKSDKKDDQSQIEASHMYQNILQQVLYLIENYHVDSVPRSKLFEGAVRGMLEATGDPYSRFLNREEQKEFNHNEGGDLVGIGVEISIQGGYPLIVAPMKGGPAEKAGLQSGDRIISIGGQNTKYVATNRLSEMITGEPGTIAELGIQRGNTTFPVRVERGVIQVDYVKTALISDGKVGYIRLQSFFGEDSGSVQKFRKGLEEFAKAGAAGVIIDLRNNTGGHVDMARTLSGYFLKKGDIVYRVKSRTEQREFSVEGETGVVPDKMKVVILVNRGSASASEIMSGCLQDYGRAVLVGEQTFGKASVQQVFRPLPDETAVLVTTQRYYTPKNRSLHGVGLKPDVEIPDLTPTPQESVYIGAMEEKKLIDAFIKENPEYRSDSAERFRAKLAADGIVLRPEIVRILLKREYGVREPDPDTEVDPQLRRAIEIVRQTRTR